MRFSPRIFRSSFWKVYSHLLSLDIYDFLGPLLLSESKVHSTKLLHCLGHFCDLFGKLVIVVIVTPIQIKFEIIFLFTENHHETWESSHRPSSLTANSSLHCQSLPHTFEDYGDLDEKGFYILFRLMIFLFVVVVKYSPFLCSECIFDSIF